MKLKITEDCIGCGACEAICEKVFKVDGVSKIVMDEIPEDEELKSQVQEAIDSCPTSAIVEEGK